MQRWKRCFTQELRAKTCLSKTWATKDVGGQELLQSQAPPRFSRLCRRQARHEIMLRFCPATTLRLGALVLRQPFPKLRAALRVGSLISGCSTASSAFARMIFLGSR